MTADQDWWITGSYMQAVVDIHREDEDDQYVSFAHGPFPDEATAHEVANNERFMDIVIGDIACAFEIDDVALMTYSQACKHFEETILSEYFEHYCSDCGKTLKNAFDIDWNGKLMCDACLFKNEVWEVCKYCLTQTPRELYEKTRLLRLVF